MTKEHSVFGQFFFGDPSRAEIINNPELVHAAREHMEQVFKSEEMALRHRHPTSEGR